VRVVVPAFYALKDTRLPVLAALADCLVFLSGCFTLVPIYGLPAIGLSASLAAAVNVAILLGVLRRREGRLRGREILRSLSRIALASVVMGAALWAGQRFLDPAARGGPTAALLLTGLVLGATVLYWGVAHLLGAPEPSELRRVAARPRRGA
jgi:putative peptidoglycan lipid II flippase